MPPLPRPPGSDSGFVLIGVIIFVLALTIIGISLFSLSTYEAQFLQRSLDDEQAFQSALGGIERAKFLLCLNSRLDSIAVTLPGTENVTAASAVQFLASGGSLTTVLQWDSLTTVRLQVTARVHDRQRTVEGRFIPRRVADYYRRLITVSQGITVEGLDADGRDRRGTAFLTGAIWESSSHPPSTWVPLLGSPWPTDIRRAPSVPLPDVQGFLAEHPGSPDAPHGFPYPAPQDYTVVYTLDVGADEIGFWETDGNHPDWSLYVGYVSHPNGSSDPLANLTELDVCGFAVWLLPRGVIFEHQVKVLSHGGGEDCLVIIAGPNGIHFNGGIRADVPVVLVSSGEVSIRHENEGWGGSVDGHAVDLSVFARSARLMGPVHRYFDAVNGIQYDNTMRLDHPVSGRLNQEYVSTLLAGNALPNLGSSTGHALDLVRGTWRASAP